jgi:hypothetical protein
MNPQQDRETAHGASCETWTLGLRDRAGALERLLSLLRRRRVRIDALSLTRAGPDLLEVALTLSLAAELRERVAAEVGDLHDVYLRTPGPDRPVAPESTLFDTEDEQNAV